MAPITDEITGLVKNMSLPELQNMVLRLAEQNEHIRAALQQVWREKEREIRLRASVEWAPADWFQARKHFEPIITDELERTARWLPVLNPTLRAAKGACKKVRARVI